MVRRADPAPSDVQTIPVGGARVARILVVDDDDAMRAIVEHPLRRQGHDVVGATNGAHALRLLGESSFDLVITDLVMPEVEGLELVRALRNRVPRPRIIAMSGAGHGGPVDYLVVARTLGATATLAKPFTQQALLDLVAQVLDT
jgi:DNA-binding NtrC family response regulator